MSESEEVLLQACKVGDLNLVRETLSKQVNLNYEDVELGTPLCQAIQNKHNEIVQILLDAGADSSQPVFVQHLTPLFLAIISGNDEAAEMIFSQGNVDVNYQNKTGENALMYCIKYDRPGIAERILENPDVDLTVLNSDHQTALMVAALNENVEILKLILYHEYCSVKDVNFENEFGVSALSIAKGAKKKEILHLIEDAGIEHFQTFVGKILKNNNLRQHCERFFALGIKTREDARKLDDKFLSWKLRVDNQNQRDKILRLFREAEFRGQKDVKANRDGTSNRNNFAVAKVIKNDRTRVNGNESIINSLPNAPKNQVMIAEPIIDENEEGGDDSVPVAKLVPLEE